MSDTVSRPAGAESVPEDLSQEIKSANLAFLVDGSTKLVAAGSGFWRLTGSARPRPGVTLSDLKPAWGPVLATYCRDLLNDKTDMIGPRVRELTGSVATETMTVTLAPLHGAGGSPMVLGYLGFPGGNRKQDSHVDNYVLDRGAFLSRLAHQISHELRNPCTIIGGFAALLKRNLEPADKLSEYAAIIVAETLRLEKTLEQVLNFLRAQSRSPELIDLNEVISAALDAAREGRVTGDKSLTVAADRSLLLVNVNRDQAVRSLYDIIAIAGKELPEEVGIAVGSVSTGTCHQVLIEFVAEPENRQTVTQKLSDLFSRGAPSGGLRLTLAVEAIKLNGGDFSVAGTAAGNTRICVEYPAAEESDA